MIKAGKKLLSIAAASALVLGVCLSLAACGGIRRGVSSIEDLYAMQDGKSYKLDCDIDLKGGEWYPLSVGNFDGAGHTIGNCTINTTSTSYDGFFRRASKLNNVVFDNITVNISFSGNYNGMCGGIAAGQVDKEVKGVTVKNSELTVQTSGVKDGARISIGGIVGEYRHGVSAGIPSGITGVYDCKLENSSLSVIGFVDYVGGIAGEHVGGEMSNCHVVGSAIKSNTGYIGGITGYGGGSVSRCVFEQSDIEANNGNAGGIVGLGDNVVSRCAVYGGGISVSSDSYYRIGGAVSATTDYGRCKISDCLVGGLNISGSTSSAKTDVVCRIGGLCAGSDSTISKCVVYDCVISGTGSTKSKHMTTNGFSAFVGGSINNCAVVDTVVSGGTKDAFCPKSDTVFNCLLRCAGAPNVNDIPVFDGDDLNELLSALSLDESIWSVADGAPKLNTEK